MTEQLVTLHADDKLEYALLEPGNYPPREGKFHNRILTNQDVPFVLDSLYKADLVAIDLETKGGDYSDWIEIVGIGFAWSHGSCYIPWTEMLGTTKRDVLNFIHNDRTRFIAHNVYFDGGVLFKLYGKRVNWYACTYALFAMLANDGHPGQYWGLKGSQTEFLGWESSNETELDEWLVLNGYYKGNKRVDNSEEYLRTEFQAGKLKPEKGEMWRAPVNILGKYCILDAESTYLLFTEVLNPVWQKFPDFVTFFRHDFMHLITKLIDQKIHGIPMDIDKLHERKRDLEKEIIDSREAFLKSEQVSAHISDLEKTMIQVLYDKEPARLKKDGDISKNWLNWQERVNSALRGEVADYKFNIQSGPQLRKLLYDCLGMEKRIFTETGEPGIGIKALKHMGPTARLLIDYNYARKELGFIDDYIERTSYRKTIHPSFRSPGTVTGRLSSKEPNMQQTPKTKAMMNLFTCRPGRVWVDLDFSALEPVVATEFSQDPNMMLIYGDSRPQNDIYLFVGANIEGMGKKIRAAGYDPVNPSPEGLKRAKTECKHERSICKTVVLACQYGAGVNKILQTLENDDIFLDYIEVQKIHTGYWDLFAKVKDFSKGLEYEWRRNGGYILNGLGRPMAVPPDMTKDILNRFVQSTGHDILIMYIRMLSTNLDKAGIPWDPIVIDFHDASTIEVDEQYKDQVIQIFNDTMDDLNNTIQGTIKLRGVPVAGYNLSQVKEPEE